MHDRHKRGHPFFHGLGVSMPRPFRKGIACHGSMYTLPFCPELFVDLDNDVPMSYLSIENITKDELQRLLKQISNFRWIIQL